MPTPHRHPAEEPVRPSFARLRQGFGGQARFFQSSGGLARRSAGRREGGWTIEDVERRIISAADTLARLPVPDIQRNVTRWPDFVRDSREAYGYAAARVQPAPATPRAITDLDETLDWLRWLPRAAQRIAWSRASGFSWRKIAALAGKSPNTCRAWYLAALHRIATRLNAAEGVKFPTPTHSA